MLVPYSALADEGLTSAMVKYTPTGIYTEVKTQILMRIVTSILTTLINTANRYRRCELGGAGY